jgi:hypothetical protein
MQDSYPKNPFCALELFDSSWKRELTLVFQVPQESIAVIDRQDLHDNKE